MNKKFTLTSYFLIFLVLTGLHVRAQNPPTFTSTGVTTATENAAYTYGIVAQDADNDPLTFSATTLPSWLTFSASGQNTSTAFGSTIAGPGGVAGDADGNVYVAQLSGASIYKITPDGTTTVWAPRTTSYGSTYGMVVVGGYLYVGYYGCSEGYITRIALNNPGGGEQVVFNSSTTPYSGGGGVLSMTERGGYLYAALYCGAKIIKINLSDFQASDHITSGIPNTGPFGVGFDPSGNLYIATWSNRTLLKWDGTSLTTALSGLPASVSDVKIDANGYIYLSLYGNSIRKYTPDLASYVTVASSTAAWGMTLTPGGALVYGHSNQAYRIQTGAVLSGTPTHADVGVHPVTVQVTDGTNTVTQSFNITVTDPNPPTVSTYNPANNATTVATDANLSLTFNEDIKKGTGNITIKKSSDNSVVEQIDVTESRITVSGSTVTIDLASNLPGVTDVYVEIDATAILDISDNAYAGISNTTTWKFQTAVQKIDQTITFAATGSATYGDADFDPGATSSNTTIPVTYTSSDLSVATIVSGKVHILKTGTTTITASQAGDATYNAAPDKTQTLTINPKSITVTLNTSPAITKVYDGSTAASLAAGNYTLNGIEGSDAVTASGTATYDTKDAGTGKTITANTFVLAGAQKDNYSLSTTSAATTGAITAKPVTLTLNASPAITKVYDGSATAALAAGNYTLNGIETGDAVTVSGTAAYDNKNAGSGKTITATTFVLAGAQKDNYSLSTTSAATTGEITAKPVTLTLNASPAITKVYDGSTTAALAAGNYTLNGIETGDAVTVSGTATYDNKNAATGKTITGNAFALTGAQKDNYSLSTASATTTGTISKKVLTVTADDKTKFQGTANPSFTVSYSGFITGESESVLSTAPVASTTADASSAIGTYPITVSGGSATNYSFNYVAGVLTVNPGAPTDIALAGTIVYENQASNTKAGTFSSVSEDPNAMFTYSLVSGTGSTDNSSFVIAGNELRTASSLNYEQKSSYSIRIRSTTQHGLSLDKQFTVTIQDVNEAPTLAVISDQTVCFTSAPQTIHLSGITAGPETSQSTSVTVSSTNTDLFDELSINGSSVNYRIKAGQDGLATITVTVTDNGGTANGGTDTYSRSFNLSVNPLPVISISTDKGVTEISKGDMLVLTATGGSSYSWSSSPGIISGQNTPSLTIRPEQTTTYRVAVTSAAGCTSEQNITIIVKEDYIMVNGTNILSPNGDGKNDNFVIKNIDMYPNNTVNIYDRAGRLLYSKVNYTDEWNGTFQGSPLAQDTYYYIVDFGPDKPKIKGFITIVRD